MGRGVHKLDQREASHERSKVEILHHGSDPTKEQGRRDREASLEAAEFWDNFRAEMDRKLGR